MQFIDEVRVRAEAGHGGAGCVAFRREKFVPRGGPAGGDGGHGGSVVFVGSVNTNTLYRLRHQTLLKAERGRNGEGSNKTGRSGDDLEVRVPLGTIVYELKSSSAKATSEAEDQAEPIDQEASAGPEPSPAGETEEAQSHPDEVDPSRPPSPRQKGRVLGEVTKDGERLVIARGGRGGQGNSRFTTATRQAPRFAQPGEEGEEFWLRCELKLLADVGVVGLPNAGKSTLISSITAATPKIADYPFTTLVPQLGVVARGVLDEPFVIADLPGLIAGASEGAGLGHRFLRHVERCRVLVHLVDLATGEMPADEELSVIEAELESFDPGLLDRPRVLVGTKIDSIDNDRAEDLRAAAKKREKKLGRDYFEISSVTHQGTDELVARLGRLLQETPAFPLVEVAEHSSQEPEDGSGSPRPTERLTLDNLDSVD